MHLCEPQGQWCGIFIQGGVCCVLLYGGHHRVLKCDVIILQNFHSNLAVNTAAVRRCTESEDREV